jgi:hypothetical protein
MGQLRMNNPEKLTTLGTEDEEKQDKTHTAQYVSWTPLYASKHK